MRDAGAAKVGSSELAGAPPGLRPQSSSIERTGDSKAVAVHAHTPEDVAEGKMEAVAPDAAALYEELEEGEGVPQQESAAATLGDAKIENKGEEVISKDRASFRQKRIDLSLAATPGGVTTSPESRSRGRNASFFE